MKVHFAKVKDLKVRLTKVKDTKRQNQKDKSTDTFPDAWPGPSSLWGAFCLVVAFVEGPRRVQHPTAPVSQPRGIKLARRWLAPVQYRQVPVARFPPSAKICFIWPRFRWKDIVLSPHARSEQTDKMSPLKGVISFHWDLPAVSVHTSSRSESRRAGEHVTHNKSNRTCLLDQATVLVSLIHTND